MIVVDGSGMMVVVEWLQLIMVLVIAISLVTLALVGF